MASTAQTPHSDSAIQVITESQAAANSRGTLTAGRALAWTLAFILPAYVLILFGHDLWRPAEMREAGIAREMIETGEWTATHLNGVLFLEKPPLYTWALAASLKAFGYHAWAVRIPVFIFAVGTLLLTFSLALRRVGPAGALAASLALATMWLFLEVHFVAMIDNGLVFFMTLAMCAFERMSSGERKGAGWPCLFYAALALAFLTKGGIGVVLTGMAVVCFTIWHKPRPVLSAWHPMAGLAIMAILAGGWVMALWLRGGAHYFEVFFIRHHLIRFLGLTPYHAEGYPSAPWHYYFEYLIAGPAPWTLLIPAGVWLAVKQAGGPSAEARRYWRLMACWVGGMFLILSASQSKDNQYLLPIFPPLAIAIGAWVERISREERAGEGPLPRWAVILTALSIALPAAAAWIAPLLPALMRQRPWAAVDFAAAAILFAAGAWTLAALARGAWARAWSRTALLAFIFIAVFAWRIKPLINERKSCRPFCAMLSETMAPGSSFYGFNLNENTIGGLIFYGPRPQRLNSLLKTVEWGKSSEPVYLLMEPRQGTWEQCDLLTRSGNWRVINETREGRRSYRLLGNRACPPANDP